MNDIEMWKLGTDIALVVSLAYLVYRFVGSPSAKPANLGKVRELEASLKDLMNDAERAARELDSQLAKRQSTLQKLLAEIEAAETRVSRANIEPQRVVQQTTVVEPPSFETPLEQKPAGGTNIFGEPIGATPTTNERPKTAVERHRALHARTQGIERKVEVEISPKAPYAQAMQNNMKSIYESAEDLLRAGKDLEYVTAKTKLPEEEVRLLAHMVSQEKALRATEEPAAVETPIAAADPRLGVLSQGIKRQRMTV